MPDHIIPNTAEAVAFLQAMHPEGPWHLVAMKPDGAPVAQTFDPNDLDAMSAWIDDRQGLENLYFHVNVLTPGCRDKKARKDDVKEAAFLHVDVDDLDALSRIERFAPRPTVVLFSGGGYQVFWQLSEICSDLERVERCNMRIAADLGGDKCHNIDRIMRLPGTINVPNTKKRDAGRTSALAYVVTGLTDWDRRYPIDTFTEQPPDPPPSVPLKLAHIPMVIDLDALPASVTDFTKTLIRLGDDPEKPSGGSESRYRSRSEVVFRVACDLVRAGVENEAIASILLCKDYGISASVREKPNPTRYAERQVASALEAVSRSWPDVRKSGAPSPTLKNTILAVRRLELTGEYDEFHKRKILGGRLLENFQRELSDDACLALRMTIIEKFGFDPYNENTRDAVNAVCIANTYHPVRDYLRGLEWDRAPRLERWLSTYLGAEDTPLNRAFGSIVLMAAVRRIREPGAKFDNILVLEGTQGSGKSTAIQILAGPENFSDQDILTLDAKTQMEAIEGVWIYEISELQGIGRAEISKVKAFASRSVDRGRPAYGRFRENRPRQTIFIGTTNDDRYLRDPTGNRRFWPVRTGEIDLPALRRDRDQLWAEAAYREAQGLPIVLVKNLWDAAREAQEARMEDEPWADALVDVQGDLVTGYERISSMELLTQTLDISPERQQPFHGRRLAAIMRKLGWDGPKNVRLDDGKVVKGYERLPGPDFKPRPKLSDKF